MCSPFPDPRVRPHAWLLALLSALLLLGCGKIPTRRVLHVAADPNNLPFSNARHEGFENRIAELIARDLGARLVYDWRAQRRGFFREAFAGGADLVLGVPAGFERALTTRPYYRSAYVFVLRADRGLAIHSLDDPALHGMRIGVPFVSADAGNSPPWIGLVRRGLMAQTVPYSLYGDYAKPNPPARLIDAVAKGEVDAAIAWGPLAGYFAEHSPTPLFVAPVTPSVDTNGVPFVYDIAVGVRKDEPALRDEIDACLAREQPAIAKILARYGVPTLALEPAGKAAP